MGGEGSGNWYRFNKKTTVEECRSLDVRRLHREEGLLRPGWLFSWSWSRSGREMASIGGLVEGEDRAERVVLLFRHRRGLGAEWEEVQQSVTLSWTPCNGHLATSAGRGPGSSAPARGALGGLRFFTGQGSTSCADTATTSVTRASVRTR